MEGEGDEWGKLNEGFPQLTLQLSFRSGQLCLSLCVSVRLFARTTLWALLLCFSCFSFLVFLFFFSIFSPLPGKVIFLNYRKMFTLLLVLRLWWYIFQVVPDKVRIPRKQQPIDCESQCKRCKIFSTAPTTLYIVMVWCF